MTERLENELEGVEVIEPAAMEQIELGEAYTIQNVEKFTTPDGRLDGLRVTLEDHQGNKTTTALWLRNRVGQNSKLGAFIMALGKVPKQWLNKRIVFVQWSPRRRFIEVLETKKKK